MTAKNMTVKYSVVKKKSVKIAPLKVKKAEGKVIFKKQKGNKKITVNKKTGKVTVKKGIKRGKFKVTVTATAKGTKNYKPGTVKKTFRITVK